MTPAHGTPLGLSSTPLSDMSLFSDLDFPTSSTPWANGNLVSGLANYSVTEVIDSGPENTAPMATPTTRSTQKHSAAVAPQTNIHASSMAQNSSMNWLQEADSSTPLMMGLIAPSSADRPALDVLADVVGADTSTSNSRSTRQNRLTSPAPSRTSGTMEPPTRTPGSRLFHSSTTGIAGTLTRSASRARTSTSGNHNASVVPTSNQSQAHTHMGSMSPMLDLSGILHSSMLSEDNEMDTSTASGTSSNKKRKRAGGEVCPCVHSL